MDFQPGSHARATDRPPGPDQPINVEDPACAEDLVPPGVPDPP